MALPTSTTKPWWQKNPDSLYPTSPTAPTPPTDPADDPPPPPTGPVGGPGGDFPDPNSLTLPRPPDTSGWNTDGYATPGYTATDFGQYAPGGWDQGKWVDPNHQTPKYVWARIYQSNPNTAEGRANMIRQLQQAYPGTTFVGNDKANIPGVGLIDLFRAADIGEFGVSWNPVDEYRQDDPVGPGTGTGTGTGTTTDPTPTTSLVNTKLPYPDPYRPFDFSSITNQLTPPTLETYTADFSDILAQIDAYGNRPATTFTPTTFPGKFPSTPTRSDTDQAFATRVQEVLTQLMGRSQTPLASDPEIALPSAAYRGQQQRSEERQRAELAETAGFEGWNDSGAFDTELRGIQQARGENTAAYEAGLWADAAERRLTEITQAVALGSQFLTEQDQLQLQREMAELERGIEQARLEQNESQFGRTQVERGREFNLEQATRVALEQAGLRQNESQFGRTFTENANQFRIDQSARIAMEQARLNQQAAEALMLYGQPR